MTTQPRGGRPAPRSPGKSSKHGRAGRIRSRPGVEALEGRALMSLAGGLDHSFGGNGRADASLAYFVPRPASSSQPDALVVQPDGKTIEAGIFSSFGVNVMSAFGAVVIERLNANGSLDEPFAQGGLREFDNGGPLTLQGEPTFGGLALQADGKIVVMDSDNLGVAVHRFNADGSIDTTFGLGGFLNFNFAGTPTGPGSLGTSTGSSLAIGPGGTILVAGTAQVSGNTEVALARFLPNGSPDLTFGTNGQVELAIPPTGASAGSAVVDGPAKGLAVQADGSIVVGTTAGFNSASSAFAVAKLRPGGQLDPAFGSGGIAVLPDLVVPPSPIDPSTAYASTLEGVAVQPDGKIVLAGQGIAASSSGGLQQDQVLVTRILADGSADPSFAGVGFGLPGHPSPVASVATEAHGLAIQADGRIVIAGGIQGKQSVLIRLRPDGSPDLSFGVAGQSTVATYDGTATTALAIQPDGKILAASGSSLDRVLAHAAANDFDSDGKTDVSAYLTTYGAFAFRPSTGQADVIVPFGTAGAGQTIPAGGDYDGQTDLAVYLPSKAQFVILSDTGGGVQVVPFGIPGAGQTLPAPGQYEPTGRANIAAYLPALGDFAIRSQQGKGDEIIPFGVAGLGQSIPVPGDYDGDGITDLALYLPSFGAFAVRPSSGGPDQITAFGIPGAGQSIPVPGDYDGSGKTELAVYLPSLGDFVYRPANGGPDVVIPFGIPGAGRSLPAPGDYSGSGQSQVGVYLPDFGAFAYRPGAVGTDTVVPFGNPGAGRTLPFSPLSASPLTASTVAAASIEVPPAVDVITPDLVPAAHKKENAAGRA